MISSKVADNGGMDGAHRVIRWDAEQNIVDSIVDQRVESELLWKWIRCGWLEGSHPIALPALVAEEAGSSAAPRQHGGVVR